MVLIDGQGVPHIMLASFNDGSEWVIIDIRYIII